MGRKILAVLAIGVVLSGLCYWIYSGDYGRGGADRIVSVQCNTCHVQRRPEVAEKVREISSRGRLVKNRQQPAISKPVKTYTMTATAYTHTGHKTTSDTWPMAGRTIAINPAKFKLNERMYIKGFGWRIAEDIIPPASVKKGADIDIFMDSEFEAKKHGRKAVEIYRQGK